MNCETLKKLEETKKLY